MSRRSQAFAQGQPSFSWKVERIEQDLYGRPSRFVCTCKNHPGVKGFGNTEQEAIRSASLAMQNAVEKADLTGGLASHQQVNADGDVTATPAPVLDAE